MASIAGNEGMRPGKDMYHDKSGEQREHDKVAVKRVNKRKLAQLIQRCETERKIHKIASLYFSNRFFWVLFVPSIAATFISSVISFLATSDHFKGDGDRMLKGISYSDFFAMLTGTLAAFSTLWQALSNHLAYSTKAVMHTSVTIDLKNLTDQLHFLKINRIGDEISDDRNDRDKSPKGKSSSNLEGNSLSTNGQDEEDERNDNENKIQIDKIQKMYEQVMLGCKSTIPVELMQCFSVLSDRLEVLLPSPLFEHYCFRDDLVFSREDIMSMATTEMYAVVTEYWLYPWKFPPANDACRQVLRRLASLLRVQMKDKVMLLLSSTDRSGRRISEKCILSLLGSVEDKELQNLLLQYHRGMSISGSHSRLSQEALHHGDFSELDPDIRYMMLSANYSLPDASPDIENGLSEEQAKRAIDVRKNDAIEKERNLVEKISKIKDADLRVQVYEKYQELQRRQLDGKILAHYESIHDEQGNRIIVCLTKCTSVCCSLLYRIFLNCCCCVRSFFPAPDESPPSLAKIVRDYSDLISHLDKYGRELEDDSSKGMVGATISTSSKVSSMGSGEEEETKAPAEAQNKPTPSVGTSDTSSTSRTGMFRATQF